MSSISKELFEKAKNLLSSKGYVTVAHLSEELGIEPAVASRVYRLLKSYCMAEGTCIENKQVLYHLKIESKELSKLREQRLKKAGSLETVILFTLKLLGEGKDCVMLNELIQELLRRIRTPSPYILAAIYKLWYGGLIIERYPACFKAVD